MTEPALYAHRKQHGLTLIELLIAIAITALIGIAAATLLRAMIDNQQQIDQHHQRLSHLQHSLQVMQADLDQIVLPPGRPTLGPLGLVSSADSAEPGLLIEFIRSAAQATLHGPPEQLIRVRYRYSGTQLLRESQPISQPADPNNWQHQRLFDQLDNAQIAFFQGQWYPHQPDQLQAQPLTALRIDLQHRHWQQLQLVSLLPQGSTR